jgi:hypothetical protein
MVHAYAAKFNMIGNLEKNRFWGKLNKALD